MSTTDGLSPLDCLAGGGDMGALMRSVDWSTTIFGPVSSWPQSLRTAISMMLESGFAMVVAWGPEFRFFYNDRYRPVLGSNKHPAALGTPAAEIFPEVWPVIGPAFERVRLGEALAVDDWLLPLDRNGYLENCWFTLSYSPIRDETGGVGGLLAVVAETTGRVEGERRLATLRELAQRAADATSPEQACTNAGEVFGHNPIDIPFALIYLLDPAGTSARRACSVGLAAEQEAASPESVNLEDAPGQWPLAEVVRSGEGTVVTDVRRRFPQLLGGSDDESVHTAVLLPLSRPGVTHPYGVLVAGVSPRRALDDRYRGFFDLAADHIATAISNALALEEARHRAEALAEIDRAKTAFFSNVSHEFRTPLTLMLGPAEDLVSGAHGALSDAQRDQVEILHRNANRLLKLVNALLDFSRIEAGRVEATYEPVDLSRLTMDLASAFRSAVERAGVVFEVSCPPLAEPAYVDVDMWEKVVLNLLSNAFKFTFEGRIAVTLQENGNSFELTVADSGIGIAEHEIPHLFTRFHRIQGVRARTHEGSGIGLALVHELTRLHAGTIRVDSRVGSGTTFTVSIPKGSAHLAQDRIGGLRTLSTTSPGAIPFVGEASRWLSVSLAPGGAATLAPEAILTGHDARPVAAPSDDTSPRRRILVADDNADMRDYLQRLLGARWDVEVVADGAAALNQARQAVPDLIIADVMMPGLDGFQLLKALRGDERTTAVPILLLSARAGEESRVEGLEAGADDYLVKPFSARELLARVQTHLELSRLRTVTQESVRSREAFFSAASHELRNPIHALQMQLLSVLRKGEGDGELGKEWVVERVGKAANNVARLVRLVDNLLDATRVATGRLDLELHDVDLADIVKDAVDRLEPGDQALVQLSVAPAIGHWDRLRVDQVVTNLLSNALKYGGGKPIDVEVRARAGQAELVVTDRGVGIRPEDHARIFERFERADRREHYEGFGLGLWISNQIVKALGGAFSVTSQLGEGATFRVVLPTSPLAS